MSQSEHKLELESQFILRVPENLAEKLRQALRSGEPLSKRLAIKFDSDIRHGYVRFDKNTCPARLYDLPTILESYKTLDRKNFYKTADISQILICKNDSDSDSSIDDHDEAAKKAKFEKLFSATGGNGKREFLFPHGITPPLKNVRKRRFRKTLKKKYVDFSEIEKEVKRLFKFDCEAIDTKYEIVEESKSNKVQPSATGNDTISSPIDETTMGMQSTENSQTLDLHAGLFGEISSSSDDSEDADDDDDDDLEVDQENDKDQENDDNIDFDDQESNLPPVASNVEQSAPDIAAELAAASDLIAQNDDNNEKKEELNRELAKIRERIIIQENEFKELDNPALRMRLQPVLDSLHEQERELRRQFDELS